MKPLLVLIISAVSIISCHKVNAQILTSLPDSGAVWEYCECMQTWGPPGYTCNKFTISIGDTAQIKGESYRKYYKVRAWHNDTMIHYLREDSTNKIFVLRFIQNDTIEEQLYDFGSNVGDSIFSAFYTDEYIGQIDSIDTIYIANQYRKRFFVSTISTWSTGQTEIWIKGIGSTTDFLHPFVTINTYDFWSNLLTFGDSDSSFYDSGDTCRYYNSLKETLTNNGISVYPNPTSNIINIKNKGTNKIDDISLLSIEGKIVLSNQISTIDVSDIAEGVYIIRLNIKGKFSYSKVIITH